MQDDIIIATIIRRLRRERNISQAQIATVLNLPQPVVSKIERAERRVALGELRLICKLLGLPLADFIAEYQTQVETVRTSAFGEGRTP